ncbi:MAG: pirin family protein [Alphaproteobacteria bacterium]|nr:pirin family protein [Alphaproteobacteria bacterium]
MMIRPSAARGRTRLDWLDSHHSFSFGDYFDPDHMGFGPLRVLNEDHVRGGAGFAAHGHRDMEIVTIVLSGALAHRDSLGNGSIIRPGDIQHMSAGTGIVHSEFNGSAAEPVHFLQIWILPDRAGHAPRYGQIHVPLAERAGRLRLLASGEGRDGTIPLHQDADFLAGVLAPGERASLPVHAGRRVWVQVAGGSVELGGARLEAGDGAGLTDEGSLDILALTPSEIVVIDMGG